MRTSSAFYVLLVIVGLAILSWPEEHNVMLVQVARHHGPSRLDMIGLVFMAIGYVPLAIITFRRFPVVQRRLSRRVATVLVVAYFASLIVIAIALIANQEVLLWFAVVIATISQLVLTGTALASQKQS